MAAVGQVNLEYRDLGWRQENPNKLKKKPCLLYNSASIHSVHGLSYFSTEKQISLCGKVTKTEEISFS